MITMKNCGSCTACCTVVSVPALNKAAGVRCQHLTANGCGIYEDRPSACQVFDCGFRVLGLAPRLRPDRAGFMIYPQDTKVGRDTFVMFICGKIKALAKRKAEHLARKAGVPVIWRTWGRQDGFLGDAE